MSVFQTQNYQELPSIDACPPMSSSPSAESSPSPPDSPMSSNTTPSTHNVCQVNFHMEFKLFTLIQMIDDYRRIMADIGATCTALRIHYHSAQQRRDNMLAAAHDCEERMDLIDAKLRNIDYHAMVYHISAQNLISSTTLEAMGTTTLPQLGRLLYLKQCSILKQVYRNPIAYAEGYVNLA